MIAAISGSPERVYYADRVVVEHFDGHNNRFVLKCLTEFNELVSMFRRQNPGERMSFSLSAGEFRCTFLGKRS